MLKEVLKFARGESLSRSKEPRGILQNLPLEVV